jgi:hypothetical protein
MVVLHAAAIAVKPFGRCLGPQSVRGHHRQGVQGVAEGLADEFQPVEDANSREVMRGVRALAATHVEEATLAHPSQEGVEPQESGLSGDQPGPALAQPGMVEARIDQLEAECLLPVDATAHRVSRLSES